MKYQIRHVTDDVTWPRNVLWGNTVGYPSDSLASCPVWCKLLTFHVALSYCFCGRLALFKIESQSSNINMCVLISHHGWFKNYCCIYHISRSHVTSVLTVITGGSRTTAASITYHVHTSRPCWLYIHVLPACSHELPPKPCVLPPCYSL